VTPGTLFVVGILLSARPDLYFKRTLPFLFGDDAEVFADFNVSLAGAGAFLQTPTTMIAILRVLVLAAGVWLAHGAINAAAGSWALRLITTTAIIITTTMLTFGFSWNLYAVLLVPLLASVILPGSVVRAPVAVVALLLIGSPDVWLWRHTSSFTTEIAALRVTAGLVLLLAAFAYAQLSAARREATEPAISFQWTTPSHGVK
jgi:arabinofuranan 3-O-arabinosyltransferase